MKKTYIIPLTILAGVSMFTVSLLIQPTDDADFPGPFIPVEAEKLYQSYQQNPNEADRLYKGKGVALTGKITGMGDQYSLRADVNNIGMFEKTKRLLGWENAILLTDELRIVCLMSPRDESGLRGLTRDDSIRLQGVCKGLKADPGDEEVKYVLITGCRLVAEKDNARER